MNFQREKNHKNHKWNITCQLKKSKFSVTGIYQNRSAAKNLDKTISFARNSNSVAFHSQKLHLNICIYF